jgi:hypothetical protein
MTIRCIDVGDDESWVVRCLINFENGDESGSASVNSKLGRR